LFVFVSRYFNNVNLFLGLAMLMVSELELAVS
jgi:hypothetical protein